MKCSSRMSKFSVSPKHLLLKLIKKKKCEKTFASRISVSRPSPRTHCEKHCASSRHDKTIRDYFCDHGFFDIETPILVKERPKEAVNILFLLDYTTEVLCPSAIPSTAQTTAHGCGFDRYFQVPRFSVTKISVAIVNQNLHKRN